MSEATDLIAEVKRSTARVERGIANFEKDVETVGAWTDLAQLRIAASRLKMFEDSLRSRRVDLENAAAESAVQDEPTTTASPSVAADAEPVVEESVAAQEPAVEAAPVEPVPSDTPEPAADTEAQDAPSYLGSIGARPLTDEDVAPVEAEPDLS